MEPIGDEVRREVGRFGPAAGVAQIVEVWPEAVGPAVARNAWPARVSRDGTLHVATSSSAWAFELAHHAPEIRGRLQAALGEAAPAGLRFAAGPLPERGAEAGAEAAAPTVRPGPQERRLAASLTAGLADEELRELVARAAAASLARAAPGRSV
jgi:hypothetical protein